MNSLKCFKMITNMSARHIHTGLRLCFIEVVKRSRIMHKLMNVKGKAKRKWYEPPANSLPTVKNIAQISKMTGKQGSRRAAMLNKMFMKNISDLLCTGSLSQDILGRGLEISKVDITADYQVLRVYWVAGSDEHNKELEVLLNRTAGTLRHELSQLRLMGEVPTIMFVKDDHAARIHDMDSRLARADYGEGYEPKTIGHLLKSDFTLNTKLPPEMRDKIHQLEREIDEIEEPAPEMTHSVYGLDHDKIMRRLRGAHKSNEDAWGRLNVATLNRDDVVSYRASGGTQENYDFAEQKKNLTKFLEKRQIEQNKLHKSHLNRDAERNIVFQLQDKEDDYYEEQFEIYEEDFGFNDLEEEPEDKPPSPVD